MKLTRAAVATAASLLLALTACGSSESLGGDASDSGATATEEQSSESTTETGEPPEETAEAGGEVDQATWLQTVTDAQLEAETASLEADFTVAGQEMSMNGVVRSGADLESSAMRAETTIAGGPTGDLTMQMIMVDGTMYMNLGQLSGGKFIKLDLQDPAVEQLVGDLQSQTNLAETTAALKGAVVGFEEAGTETIDGVETTRFDVEVDTEKFFRTQGGLGDLPPSMEVPDTIAYSFWVTDDDLPVKVTTDMGALGTMEMRFSDWGEPVDITAPPAGQISKQNPFAPAA